MNREELIKKIEAKGGVAKKSWTKDNTCPNCGEIKGEGRLCRKCAAALDGADDCQ